MLPSMQPEERLLAPLVRRVLARGERDVGGRAREPLALTRLEPGEDRDLRDLVRGHHARNPSCERRTRAQPIRPRAILGAVTLLIDGSLDGIDWAQAKADLAADDFDNGRTADALRRAFEQSRHVAFARVGDRVVGMARLLSDGVSNAYLVDVWTASTYRRRGIASAMVKRLLDEVPGQHVGLQTDDMQAFYESLGFGPAAGVPLAASSARGSTTRRIGRVDDRIPDSRKRGWWP